MMKQIAIPEGTQTKFFFLGERIADEVPGKLDQVFPGLKPWIVADDNTWRAAGKAVADALKRHGCETFPPTILPGSPIIHASEELSQKLAAEMPEKCVPLAIGSGTINDLIKRASGINGVPYCCMATACSVDGYTSSGAALLVSGFKKTMPCPPPYMVLADTAVLAAAPEPMFAAGYADLLAKVFGGADWTIADELGIEKIDSVAWPLVQTHLREWLSDFSDFGAVFHGLCCTGYSMQLYHDSRPASGAEHLCSHVWEMEQFRYRGDSVSHGFTVGLGMLLSSQLMQFVIDHSKEEAEALAAPPLTLAEREKEVSELLRKGCYGSAAETAMKKFLAGDAMLARRKLIFDHWETIRTRLAKHYLPLSELQKTLKKAGCPASPADVAMDEAYFRRTPLVAQLIRARYTVLDLLYEAGLLRQAAAAIR